MANNTREFYKKQLGDMTNSQLLEVMHGTPVGLMSTTVGSDRMKIALELIQERWDALEQRIQALESLSKRTAIIVPKMNKKALENTISRFNSVGEKKRGRGRPKTVSAS